MSLPTRTRIRLGIHSRIDRIACWLIDHQHRRVAEYLWRACRMW